MSALVPNFLFCLESHVVRLKIFKKPLGMPNMVSGQTCPVPWSRVTHRMDLLPICSGVSHQLQVSPLASTWSFLSLPQESSGADRDYFWLRPILSSSLPTPVPRLAHVGQLLKPPAQWAAILGCLFLAFTRASWLTHSPVGPRVVLGQGGSPACFLCP